jgi:tight adherence protein C
MNATVALGSAAVVLATMVMLLVIRELYIHSLNVRVSNAVMGGPGQTAPVRHSLKWLSSIGARYRRFYSQENLEQMRAVIQSSGFNPHRALPILIGGKTVSMFLFPAAALIFAEFLGSSFTDVLIYTAMGAAIGVMGPRWVMWFIRRRFNASVQRGTADAIDLLVVCSEAGMGLESALEHVAKEMNRSSPAMSGILYALLDDLRVLPNRRDAFENLAQRSSTDGLRRFSVMINQSLQYGTGLSHALRGIAEELRRERIIKLEERAHKLGAKLIIPMVLFMLPAMFVILGGSSFLHLMQAFSQHH